MLTQLPRPCAPGQLAQRRGRLDVIGAGLTQAWEGQPSYGRPDRGKGGKTDVPQWQEARRAPHRKDHGGCDEVRWHGKQQA
ncbi:hypothetical protein BHM03_00040835 [Ensete ventricosum]|nr:hypothetical protein BHM03_00040835 [Ensete ventricosum]